MHSRLMILWVAILLNIFYCIRISAQTKEIDSLRNLLNKASDDSTRISCMVQIAFSISRSNISEAKSISFQAFDLADKAGLPYYKAMALIFLGGLYTKTGQFDSAEYYLEAGKSVPDGFGDDNTIRYHNYSGLLQKEKANYPLSIFHYRQSLSTAKKINRQADIAGSFINIGNAYRYLGNFDSSYHYLLDALKIFEKIGDKSAMAFCYNNIGNVLTASNQHDKALEYYLLSIELKKELKDSRGIASTEINLGNVWKEKKKYVEAITAYKNALSIFEDLDMKKDIGSTYIEIGSAYKARGDIQEAKRYFDQADLLLMQSGIKSLAANLNLERGKVSGAEGIRATNEDGKSLITGLQQAQEIGDKELVRKGYKYLEDYYKQRKDFEQAFQYSQKYFALNDSLVNSSLLLQYRQLETAYGVEKKR